MSGIGQGAGERCRLCGEPLRWELNEKRQVVALDANPSFLGTVAVLSGRAQALTGQILEAYRASGQPLYTLHAETCTAPGQDV